MILITGSTGYIGSHISDFFDKKKINYIGVDNHSYSYKKNVRNKKKHLKVDISNIEIIRKIIKRYKINLIIHTAASSYVIDGEKNKKKYFLNNIKKTKKFIDLCKYENLENFIFLSSSNVYNEKNIFNENDKTKSKNFYGKNKITIENYLKKKNFNNLIILRLFNVIGFYNKLFKPFKFKEKNYQRILFQIQERLKNNRPIKLRYYKKNKKKIFPSRDFVDIKILFLVIKKIIDEVANKNVGTKVLNVGSGIATPIDKIIKTLEKLINKKIKTQYELINIKELISTKANISKLKKFLKKDIKFNLKNTLNSYINY